MRFRSSALSITGPITADFKVFVSPSIRVEAGLVGGRTEEVYVGRDGLEIRRSERTGAVNGSQTERRSDEEQFGRILNP